jgi:hypothetical protein
VCIGTNCSPQALEQRFAAELQLVRLETDAAEAAMAQRLAGHEKLQGRRGSALCCCCRGRVARYC